MEIPQKHTSGNACRSLEEMSSQGLSAGEKEKGKKGPGSYEVGKEAIQFTWQKGRG